MAEQPADIEIARAARLRPIAEVAAELGAPAEALEPYGRHIAKLDLGWIATRAEAPRARLLLVTAISPTPAGEGKTTTTIGLGDALDTEAGLLSHGQKQWLKIGMLLMQEPELLLLDEPVAGMTDDETERTGELFKTLAGKHSLVVVEHDMAFIEQLGGKVTVLHEGSVLAEGDLASVQADPRVIEVYLGR